MNVKYLIRAYIIQARDTSHSSSLFSNALATYKKSWSGFYQTSLKRAYISLLVILHTAFSAESENMALSLQKPAEHLQHLLTWRGAYIRQRLHRQTVILNHPVSKQFGLLYIYILSLSKFV